MKPFLTLPFLKSQLIQQQLENRKKDLFEIEGYIYTPSFHGQALHAGIDWYLDYGTEIYSPVDWYVMSSYNYSLCYTLENWLHTPNIQQYNHKNLSYGLWYAIQIYVPTQKVFLLFGHLSYIASAVPYTAPKLTQDDFWNDMLSCSGFALTQELIEQIDSLPRVKKIHQGDYLWDVGLSGLYIGRAIPDQKEVGEKPRKQISLSDDNYTAPHLHMNIFTRDAWGQKQTPIDPYDIYSTANEYPTPYNPKPMGKDKLWICGDDGLPICVDEYLWV